MLLLVPELFQEQNGTGRVHNAVPQVPSGAAPRGLALCGALAFLCELVLLNLALRTLHIGSVRKTNYFWLIFIGYDIDRGGKGDLVSTGCQRCLVRTSEG